MEFKEIPVRVVGPGSQPAEESADTLSYMNMPRGMAKFERPETPAPDAVEHLDGAREAIGWLRDALAGYDEDGGPTLANLSALDADSRELVNQVLGEGEVSVSYAGAVRAKTQESVLAGVWRTLYMDSDDNVICDLIEVGAAPHTIDIPDDAARPIEPSGETATAATANALPILVEYPEPIEKLELARFELSALAVLVDRHILAVGVDDPPVALRDQRARSQAGIGLESGRDFQGGERRYGRDYR